MEREREWESRKSKTTRQIWNIIRRRKRRRRRRITKIRRIQRRTTIATTLTTIATTIMIISIVVIIILIIIIIIARKRSSGIITRIKLWHIEITSKKNERKRERWRMTIRRRKRRRRRRRKKIRQRRNTEHTRGKGGGGGRELHKRGLASIWTACCSHFGTKSLIIEEKAGWLEGHVLSAPSPVICDCDPQSAHSDRPAIPACQTRAEYGFGEHSFQIQWPSNPCLFGEKTKENTPKRQGFSLCRTYKFLGKER